MALLMLSTFFLDTFTLHQSATSYSLSAAAEELLPTANLQYLDKLHYNTKTSSYDYNNGYTPSGNGALSGGGPYFTASLGADVGTGGVSVTDPQTSMTLKIIPQFATKRGEQHDNRLVYPVVGRDAQKVYTLGASGIKEDIIVNNPQGDTASFDYKLVLPANTEARLLANGGLGVYGVNSTLLGNVTTATEQDAKLLEQARSNGKKDTLLFTLPAPYVKESGVNGVSQTVLTHYGYKNDVLTIYVSGMNSARYPLTIDPTVYISSAAEFMQGNNESNIEFDGTNDWIKKGKTTGARINEWDQSLGLPVPGLWDHGATASNGYVYVIGGSSQGNGGKQIYDVEGSQNFIVPTGVSTITVKLWGAGGGGGAGGGAASGATGAGGAGGGGGFIQLNLSVTPGETLTVDVGSGGAAGGTLDNGGDGGGYSSIRRGSTILAQAAGGGGGGGSAAAVTGGAGGAGGGTASGVAGGAGGGSTTTAKGGSPGTSTTNGAGGTAGTGGIAGSIGADGAGGNAGGSGASCATAVTNTQGGAGGTGGGGLGGNATTCSSGGGGGGGYHGGGGGASANTSRGGGGGGGGSSYASVTATVDTAGSGTSPGQSGDSDRNGAGQGGSGAAVSGNNSAGADGEVVVSYTLSGGSTYTNKVYWAQFNPSTNVIQSPTPGSDGVACTSWCNNSAYDLPAATNGGLRSMSVVAYNGFLYVIGGIDGTGAKTNKVYIAKLGANGEPQLWHPTDSNKNNWVYWYQSSVTLPDTIANEGAVAYNNTLYIFGGKTGTNANGDTIAQKADILPTGDIGSWSSSGMSALPSARYGHTIQVYNDVLYLVAGRNSSGTFLTDAYYAKLNSDGTMGSWTSTNGLNGSGRANWGGNFSAIWGGYLYLGGGCTAVTGSYCSTVATDVQLASINADGSLAPWGTIGNITHERLGGTILTWQGALYRVGGCAVQNTSTGVCDNLLNNVAYGTINPDGDASTVSNSDSAGTGTCSGATPYNCDLPAPGTASQQGGQMSSMVVINNGYIYNIGGCTTLTNGTCSAASGSSSMSGNISYAVLNSDGTMGKPATCPNGAYVTNSLWCVDDANVVAGAQNRYSTGTITQSGTTISRASGTTNWTSTYIGNVFRYADGTTALITNVTSTTQMTVNASKTISTGQAYSIWTRGIGAAAATVFNNTIYIVGGTNGSGTWSSNIQYVPLANDGSLASKWNVLHPTLAPTTGLSATFPNMSYSGIGYGYAFTRANPASAGSTPGNLYILGGCAGNSSIGCSDYTDGVYKCNISTTGAVSGCSTTNQLQIDPDGSGTRYNGSGLGLMAGTVYANRVYLVGGACLTATGSGNQATDPCGSSYSGNRQDTIYAKINSSGNIVANSTTGTYANIWALTTGKMNPVRRRAISFGYNGYIYSLAGYSGSSSLQDLLFSKIDVSTGDLPNNFSSSGVVVTPRWDLRAIVSNGYVYAIGGCAAGAAPAHCGNMQAQIQTFQLYNNDSGAAASYSTGGNNLNLQRVGGSSAILNGYIYYAGGCNDMACAGVSNVVNYAPIDSYGNIGTWQTGNTLPIAGRAWGKLVAAGGGLYYVGGQTGAATTTAQSSIYYTTSISSGNPTWSGTVASNGLPAARTQAGVAVWNDRVYVISGYNASGTVQSSVYYSPVLTGGNITSTWSTGANDIGTARAGATLVAYSNNLYVFGGLNGSGNYLMDSQYASIGYKTGTISQSGTTVTGADGASWSSAMNGSTLQYPDGTIATISSASGTSMTVNVSRSLAAGTTYAVLDGSVGSWMPSTSLPGPLRDAQGFAANGYIYLLGGRSAASTCTPSTLVTPVSANTTIATGNNPTGIGEWYETNQRYLSDRYGAGVAYANGRAYLLGGGCSSLVSTANWSQYATIKSQPQIAKYSKMIDADKDVFASMWLANGVDNSTGAQWSFSYRTMNDPTQTNPLYQCGGASMSAWGALTNFGAIDLAKPGALTPKNGAGTNINCSRFYYLSFSIDASQAFGYPEDVNKGPYISDISLYYTATASGRLLHGKTFTGGLQQPLDTPCRQSNNSSDPNYAGCPLP